jgi:head-tail adaptor
MVGMRGSGPVLGRDAQGNWWFQWALRKSLWAKVEERIREMGEMTV